MTFSVISTFSGCGGSSLGYKLAGGDVRLAVEWNNNAVATYRLNFPDTPIYHGDIAKITVDQCWQKSGLEPGELDILDGSPPCQGFSTAGKRQMDDDRNQLFREYVRLLRGLKPKVFVMENVSGMVKGKMRLVFADCLREMKASGYRIKARVLNAKYFNVPQWRERMIFIGVRNDLEIEPSHPKAQGMPISVQDVIPAEVGRRYVTFRNKGGGLRNDKSSANKPLPAIMKNGVDYYSIAPRRQVPIAVLQVCQSLPAQWLWGKSTKSQIKSCLGNSVPPNFMRAIAEHIRDNILNGDGRTFDETGTERPEMALST